MRTCNDTGIVSDKRLVELIFFSLLKQIDIKGLLDSLLTSDAEQETGLLRIG